MGALLDLTDSVFGKEDSGLWECFLELAQMKEQIKNRWYRQLGDAIRDRFSTPERRQWKFKYWNDQSFGFQLEQDGPQSLALLYERAEFSLWISPGPYDPGEILKKYRNSILFVSYFHTSEISENGSFLAKRENPIAIRGLNGVDALAWYAAPGHHGHAEMFEKLTDIFEHFMKDQEIITIIKEINQQKKES